MLIQLILIQVITFVIIVAVLKKLLYTETAKEADRLKKLRDEYFAKEKELQTRAGLAQKEAEGKLSKSEEDARRYLEAKEKEADELKQGIVAKAREQAEEMIRAAANAKEKIREEIELEIKKNIPGAAVRIFKEALPAAAIEIIHSELIEEVVRRIKKLEKDVFKTKEKTGDLLSPYQVKKPEKEKLAQAISERAGHSVSLAEKEEKALVAGVVVKLGALVIDGSLENKLKQVRMRE